MTMKFSVERSGLYDTRVPPMEGAIRVAGLRADRRTFASPEEYDDRFPDDPWGSKGKDHGFWDDGDRGGIVRYFEIDLWEISIDDLSEVVGREGSIRISAPEVPGGSMVLQLGDLEG